MVAVTGATGAIQAVPSFNKQAVLFTLTYLELGMAPRSELLKLPMPAKRDVVSIEENRRGAWVRLRKGSELRRVFLPQHVITCPICPRGWAWWRSFCGITKDSGEATWVKMPYLSLNLLAPEGVKTYDRHSRTNVRKEFKVHIKRKHPKVLTAEAEDIYDPQTLRLLREGGIFEKKLGAGALIW